ncbi:Carboxylic ester hydrolase [Tolypocladium paradoxum]|uniref:Carboxylic ester hydrolase n=1 Tax=Tolypocladium paradoxum TaxID=94208 RepID=A0A2S4KY43_9HYPO|nr:Carboxylic ester hydrolase [Tolypocladium paradoxum]
MKTQLALQGAPEYGLYLAEMACMPQVDLGYEVHEALSYIKRGNTYIFSNIRYAQPPLDYPHFTAPLPPTYGKPVVQKGKETPYLHGNISNYNYTQAKEAATEVKPFQSKYDMGDEFTEDCLFLDVAVPMKTDPNDRGNPAGVTHESQHDGSDGIIFIAPNYRVGAFGWLAGASLEAINGTANVGLHDQRLALD